MKFLSTLIAIIFATVSYCAVAETPGEHHEEKMKAERKHEERKKHEEHMKHEKKKEERHEDKH